MRTIRSAATSWRSRNCQFTTASLVAAFLLSSLSIPAYAQRDSSLLIVSQLQQGSGAEKETFVDLAPYIARQLMDTSSLKPLVYKSTLPAVKEALANKSLIPSDLIEPLNKENIRKIAQALGIRSTLRVSGRLAKQGVAADAEMEALSGQQSWTVVFLQKLEPFHAKNPKSRLLEGINAQVEAILRKIANPRGGIDVTGPVEVKVPAGNQKGRGRSADKAKPSDKTKSASAKTSTSPPDPHPSTTVNPGVPTNSNVAPPTEAIIKSPAIKPKVENVNVVSANEILVDKFRRQGDLSNMIGSLRRAVNDKPRDSRLRRDLVQTYLDRGWHNAARDEATRALQLSPNDASLHRLLGDSCTAGGDPDAALREYQEAVRLNDKDSGNYIALGDGFWNAARPEEALHAFESAAKADPKNPLPHQRLAKLHSLRGEFKDCAAEITIARQLTPADDLTLFVADYTSILETCENGISDVLQKLPAIRKQLLDGTKTREKAFAEATVQRKRADEVATFLDLTQAPAGYIRVQGDYSQAAHFVVQAAEKALEFFETQDSQKDDELTLLRVEASRQISDASRKLKALRQPKASR